MDADLRQMCNDTSSESVAIIRPTKFVIDLPDDVQPGESEVDVDIPGAGKLRVTVPAEARNQDQMELETLPCGKWKCRLLRRGSEDHTRAGRRGIQAVVPVGVKAGQTPLSIDIGNGEKLIVTTPKCANPGDKLYFWENCSGEWMCRLDQQKCSSNIHKRNMKELRCIVPENVIPGITQLRLSTGLSSVVAVVPTDALPGDQLSISVQPDGSTSGMVLPPGAKPDVGEMCYRLPSVEANPENLHVALRTAVVECGGIVNPKLRRGTAPPLDIEGMILSEPMQEGEELARIPSNMFISLENCKERFPGLLQIVQKQADKLKGRQNDVFHAYCLALLLQDAEARLEQGSKQVDSKESCVQTSNLQLQVWQRYADTLVCADFRTHPYWLALSDFDAFSASMHPSREPEYCSLMVSDTSATYREISENIPVDDPSLRTSESMFLQARLCLLTRVFQLGEDSSLVPFNDCFNHSADTGANWSWDENDKSMVLVATRSQPAGTEVFISYGRRSNVLLYRTYGFTLPPEVEPDWTFAMQGDNHPQDLFARYLPYEYKHTPVYLEVQIVQSGLVLILNKCRDAGHCPEEFVRAICARCIQPYEEDANMRYAVEAYKRCRENASRSHAWWQFVKGTGIPSEDLDRQAIRIKMSEYMCLAAHIEVLDVLAGTLEEEQCLDMAKIMRGVLLKGFKILRNGSRFTLNTYEQEVQL